MASVKSDQRNWRKQTRFNAMPSALFLGIVINLAWLRCSCPQDITKPQPRAESKPSMNTVLATDIGNRVIIIGRLGVPLGTPVTVKGNWSLPEGITKGFGLRLNVTSVNGEQLDHPVVFGYKSS